jgi:hypothetical protein
VFLGRRPEEPADLELQTFYKKLLKAIDSPMFRNGHWSLCDRRGWPDNPSYQNLVAWNWIQDDDRYLIVVNLSDNAVQARVLVPWGDAGGETWRLSDALSDATYDRNGDEMQGAGLYVELGPWKCNLFECRRARKAATLAPAA